MKRSFINQMITEALAFSEKMKFPLPPFFHWTVEDWRNVGSEYAEIRDCMLGWDVTDFGTGDFYHTGLVAATIRNGVAGQDAYRKPYCEKALFVKEGQVTPMHFHAVKMEDIINRGGADLVIELYLADDRDQLSANPVPVNVDGRRFSADAGTLLRLKPGESITLYPRQYHAFWAANGDALIGEVSTVNDDTADNHFFEVPQRFPEITEDEVKKYLLCNEYGRNLTI
ncbi:D-lyxose isomerase [Clostridia bacterium]|nr:D-lyxose isomerase [Clostridia bacterium]